jgi:hypothetical protein
LRVAVEWKAWGAAGVRPCTPCQPAAFWPEGKVAHNTTEQPEDRSLVHRRTIRPLKASERVLCSPLTRPGRDLLFGVRHWVFAHAAVGREVRQQGRDIRSSRLELHALCKFDEGMSSTEAPPRFERSSSSSAVEYLKPPSKFLRGVALRHGEICLTYSCVNYMHIVRLPTACESELACCQRAHPNNSYRWNVP